jgi:radical SAM superfamily enzyme YgiQ (UPF0313 family)
MKILLVNTNRMKPAIAPIGLDYLADALVAAGHEPHLLDLCFSNDPVLDMDCFLRTFTPEAIGVTIRNTDDCYFDGQAFFLTEIKEIIGRLKQASDAPVVLGGVGFSVSPGSVLEYCGGDYGIAGDGELAWVDSLKTIYRPSELHRVPNLVYREGRRLCQNPREPVDLAQLPPRRRALVDNARYFRQGGQAGFETKRGCPKSCIYCADPLSKGRTVRLMPPARVAEELAVLLDQGIDHFHTCDSEFNLPIEHAREVCEAIIDRGINGRIRWYAYCSPAPFDDALAALFKRSGGAGINFGVDSGCDEMLRRLGRHFTTEDLARAARSCRQHGIPCMFDLLLGGPGETRETIRQTIDFMRCLEVDCIGLSMGMRVYDGTAMAACVRAEGDPATNPNLFGAKQDNPGFLKPVFYFAPDLGVNLPAYVRGLVAGDRRFFLPAETDGNSNYNYNENTVLVQAIENGARGAYWDILRRKQG